MYQGPAFALTQTLATPKIRATAAALLLFVINSCWAYCAFKAGPAKHDHDEGEKGHKGEHWSDGPSIAYTVVWAMIALTFSLLALSHFTGTSDPETFPIRLSLIHI